MASGTIFTYVGKNHTYAVVDANTSLAPNNKSMTNPQRYSHTVDGVQSGRTYNEMWEALHHMARTIRTRDYQGA